MATFTIRTNVEITTFLLSWCMRPWTKEERPSGTYLIIIEVFNYKTENSIINKPTGRLVRSKI